MDKHTLTLKLIEVYEQAIAEVNRSYPHHNLYVDYDTNEGICRAILDIVRDIDLIDVGEEEFEKAKAYYPRPDNARPLTMYWWLPPALGGSKHEILTSLQLRLDYLKTQTELNVSEHQTDGS